MNQQDIPQGQGSGFVWDQQVSRSSDIVPTKAQCLHLKKFVNTATCCNV